MKEGRSFVTNGPLLQVTGNRQLPGHVFTSPDAIEINVAMALRSLDRIPAVEIIRDGQVVAKLEIKNAADSKLSYLLRFEQSGWFLVRAVADNDKTFRFASTAPFYVEVGKNKVRISKASAMFFRDWTNERIECLRMALKDEVQLADVLKPHLEAKRVWEGLIEKANAE